MQPARCRDLARARSLSWSIVLCSGLMLGACSAVVDPQTKQCDTTDDCKAKGPLFVDTVCSPEKVCTQPRCETHAECGPALGVEQGYCRPDRVCARLFTPECERLLPADALNGEHLLLGFMAILKGDNASYGLPHLQGAELAVTEINNYGGIPGASADAPARRLALLVCDHGAMPGEVAKHLVQNLRVPAIVGASFSGVTRTVLDVATPEDVLVFSPAATSPALTTHDGAKNLFWRTAPSDNLQTEAMKLIVPMIESALRQKGVLVGDAPLRLSLPFKADDAGRSLFIAATSSSTAVTNPGAPLTSPRYGGEGGFEYLDPDNVEMVAPPWSEYVTRILANRPHVIIPLGTAEFVKSMLREIEARWDAALDYRPWYLLPEGSKDPELLAIANQNPGWKLHERIVGVAPGARQSSSYKGFAARFRAALQGAPGNLAEYAYDATYLISYATAITGKPRPTGLEYVQALAATNCAERAEILAGPTDVQGSLRRAAAERCINFRGISGPLDFDASGEAPSDYAVWCLRGDAPSHDYEPPMDVFYSYQSGLVSPPGQPALDFARPDWCKSRPIL